MSSVVVQGDACPICGSEEFEAQAGRPAARCTDCGALERHRALVLLNEELLADGTGRTALELGPLNGRVFREYLQARGWRYLAVDQSRAGNPLDPRRIDALDFESDARALSPLDDGSVELVIAQHVIEEIDDYEQALAELARVLAPGGTALLEIPFDIEVVESVHHEPDRFGNVWAFGSDLLDIVRRVFGELALQEYSGGSARGQILRCRRRRPNAVAAENARPGDGGWWGRHAPEHAIEGYASQCSARPGELLELHISTSPAARYRVTIHRLGWYGGAGGRTVASHPGASSDVQGVARELPLDLPGPAIGAARWPVTDVIGIGDDWTTGVYIARLTLTTGEDAGSAAFVPFVVRPPHGAAADVLVQQPVTTAHAYNNFGGRSLYASNSTDQTPAVVVTLDRPFPAWHSANLNARWPFIWDYQLLRFLEREGIDVAYTTDIDTHREPWSVGAHKLLMTSGHDEYWTREMRDAFDAALADGVNIACMGANTGYWQTRLDDRERTMVQHRYHTADPIGDRSLSTVQFRDLVPPRPECRLFGVQYQDGLTKPSAPPRHYELVEACLEHAWMRGTGFEYPATLEGLVGYEWDALQAGCEPSEATVFFHYECPELSHADAVAHRASSGALVFAAGSLQFAWGLDDWAHDGHADPRLQRFMRNALADLTS